jgi:glycerol transport system ATP-binding protein
MSGATVTLSTGGQLRASGAFATVPDGDYTVGFRAHHLAFEPIGGEALALQGTVSVSEITGSESYVHLDVGEHRFVALVPGVKRLEPGSAMTAYLDPRHLFLFDGSGRLAALDLAQAA